MGLNHWLTAEENRLRKFLLYLFAKYIEVPFLLACYHLFEGNYSNLGNSKIFKAIFGPFFFYPMAKLADAGKPIPFQKLVKYLENLEGKIAVGPCRCRVGHESCDHPMETDIAIRTGTEAWMKAFPEEYRVISKKGAMGIIERCHEQGMFHMLFVHCPLNDMNEYVICNCCTDGCVPYLVNRSLGQNFFPLLKGRYRVKHVEDSCKKCGACIEACPFDAREFEGGKVKIEDCFGCGLCVGVGDENANRVRKLVPSPHPVELE